MKVFGKEERTEDREFVNYTDEHIKNVKDSRRFFLDVTKKLDRITRLWASGEACGYNNYSWQFDSRADFIENYEKKAEPEKVEFLEVKGTVGEAEVEVAVSMFSPVFMTASPLDFDMEGFASSVFEKWDEMDRILPLEEFTELVREGYDWYLKSQPKEKADAYFNSQEAQNEIKSRYEGYLEDLKDGRITESMLRGGCVDSVVYCLYMMY